MVYILIVGSFWCTKKDGALGETNFIEVIMVEAKQMIQFWVKQRRKSKNSTVSASHSLGSLYTMNNSIVFSWTKPIGTIKTKTYFTEKATTSVPLTLKLALRFNKQAQ